MMNMYIRHNYAIKCEYLAEKKISLFIMNINLLCTLQMSTRMEVNDKSISEKDRSRHLSEFTHTGANKISFKLEMIGAIEISTCNALRDT